MLSRLYRVNSESEAMRLFNNFSYKLTALKTGCRTRLLTRDWLQQFCDLLRSNPGWTAAHLAARMSMIECFRSEFVATYASLSFGEIIRQGNWIVAIFGITGHKCSPLGDYFRTKRYLCLVLISTFGLLLHHGLMNVNAVTSRYQFKTCIKEEFINKQLMSTYYVSKHSRDQADSECISYIYIYMGVSVTNKFIHSHTDMQLYILVQLNRSILGVWILIVN